MGMHLQKSPFMVSEQAISDVALSVAMCHLTRYLFCYSLLLEIAIEIVSFHEFSHRFSSSQTVKQIPEGILNKLKEHHQI